MVLILKDQDASWIRLYRKILANRIWKETDPIQKNILVALLLIVNHEYSPGQWKGKEKIIKPGQLIASLEDIAYISGFGIHENDVQFALTEFSEKYDFIELKKDKKNPDLFFIKIKKWSRYQKDGLSNEENEQLKADAEKLYSFYIERIEPDPEHRSKKRAIRNILKHMKKYECRDLAKAILNYRPKALSHTREYRKDPANFFGIHESYFIDFLPKNFKPDNKALSSAQNNILTLKKLRELNE